MRTDKPEFEIGQVVYVVSCHPHVRVEVPCPVCFGKREVQIILGDGTVERIECEACGIGSLTGPTGLVDSWKAEILVSATTITGISIYDGRWKYQTDGYHSSADHILPTRELAEALRETLLPELQARAEADFERCIRDKKKHGAWTVRYHRECLKRLDREAEYHRRKMRELKEEKPCES